jgi:SAM-dependent methyltransferase
MKSEFYREYFEHENSHWWFRWRFDMITELVDSLPKDADFRLLDAGCGTGQMTKLLERYGNAVGLEIAPEAIAFARRRGVQNVVLGSISDPPFAAGSFDLVLSLDVIEHVDNDIHILSSLFEIVRPGGHLIVTVPAFEALWSEHDEINHHKRRYRVPQLRAMLEESGFEVDRITYCNTVLFLPVLVTRKARTWWRRIRGLERSDDPESDLAFHPKPINELLYRILSVEGKAMKRFDMPVGVSILAIARRPLETGRETSPANVTIDSLIGEAEQQKVLAAQ